MSVHRLSVYSTEDPFTRIPNAAIRDDRLDLKARGLLVFMLSKPDGWTFRERNLAQQAGVGREQLRSAMKTLIDAGYVVRRWEPRDDGPPIMVTAVYDQAQPVVVGNADVGNPDLRETRPISNEPVLVTNETTLAAAPREKKPRARDPIWDAIVEACGYVNPTGTEAGRAQKAGKELRDINATPEQVHQVAAAYRKKWPDMPLTPQALTGNWNQLLETAKPRKKAWSETNWCPDCGQDADDIYHEELCDAYQQHR